MSEKEQGQLQEKQKKHEERTQPLGKVVHAEPLQHKPLSEALSKLPDMDLKK